MSTTSTPLGPNDVDEKSLLLEFEWQHMPPEYRDYYAKKRHNFCASIQNFGELWDLYLRMDAIWLHAFADLEVATDLSRTFPLILFFNTHAKIRVSVELVFATCTGEARSILRDAVEFLAHAHWMLTDTELQKTWLSKNDDEAAFKNAFEHYKQDRVFKGLDELYRTWCDLSETGSHANINAIVDRFVQVKGAKNVEFKMHYTGMENPQMWVMMTFGMLMTCWTMLEVFVRDYDGRLKFDDTLRRMRVECDRVKEHLREKLKARYKIEPPGGIHMAPKPVILRL